MNSEILDKSSSQSNGLVLGTKFSEKKVSFWLETIFVFNPFVNLFLITESLFAMCPNDNFYKQEEFIAMLMELKASGSTSTSEETNLRAPLCAPTIGQLITIKEYVKHAPWTEFYCLNLLVVVKLDWRRKLRFIRITDCFSIATDFAMKRFFDVAYLGGAYSSQILSNDELSMLNQIREKFCKYSSDYGAKYKQMVDLNFDHLQDLSDTAEDQLINSPAKMLGHQEVRFSGISMHDSPGIQLISISNVIAVLMSNNTMHDTNKLKFYRCSGMISNGNLFEFGFGASTALCNKIMLCSFNSEDEDLWIKSDYFSTYFLINKSNNVNILANKFLSKGVISLSFDDICQPVAPVNVENDFYRCIFSHIVAQQLLHNRQVINLLRSSRTNLAIVPIGHDEHKQYWRQSTLFLNNVHSLLNMIGVISPDSIFCNSSGQARSFDLVVALPNSVSNTPQTNYSYIDRHTFIPKGDVLYINPFDVDLHFKITSAVHCGEIIVLRRYSYMLLRGALKLCLCSNYSCEILIFFKSYVLPRRLMCDVNVFYANQDNHLRCQKRQTVTIMTSPTRKRSLTDKAEVPFFAAPLYSYRCVNNLCDATHNYHHYPYCGHCLHVCLKLSRRFIDDVKGFGLFSDAFLHSGTLLLCESITNSFYEVLSYSELTLRYGNEISPNQLPYITEIPFPDQKPSLYLDQTVKRGIFSSINFSTFENGAADDDSSNCELKFEIDEHQIVLKLTTTRTMNAGEEFKYVQQIHDKGHNDCAIIFVDYSNN